MTKSYLETVTYVFYLIFRFTVDSRRRKNYLITYNRNCLMVLSRYIKCMKKCITVISGKPTNEVRFIFGSKANLCEDSRKCHKWYSNQRYLLRKRLIRFSKMKSVWFIVMKYCNLWISINIARWKLEIINTDKYSTRIVWCNINHIRCLECCKRRSLYCEWSVVATQSWWICKSYESCRTGRSLRRHISYNMQYWELPSWKTIVIVLVKAST